MIQKVNYCSLSCVSLASVTKKKSNINYVDTIVYGDWDFFLCNNYILIIAIVTLMRTKGFYKSSNKHLHHIGSQTTFVYWLEFYVTRLIENIKYRMFFWKYRIPRDIDLKHVYKS